MRLLQKMLLVMRHSTGQHTMMVRLSHCSAGTSDPSPHARRPGSSSSSAPDLPALLFCGSWDAVVRMDGTEHHL